MNRITYIVICMAAFVLSMSPYADAQNALDIKGVIVDEQEQTVPGVYIVEKGTRNGTVSDVSGSFSISVPAGSELEVTYLGYQTVTLKVTDSSPLRIAITPEETVLDELVVVGYRAVRKESLTGAVANITSKDIVTTKSPNLALNLAGKVAGFNVRQQSGQPGMFDTAINIRGLGAPLFIIDGIVRDGSTEFQRLSPDDIESISFLKDGTAAIYGMNSSNGAVIVTTKKGKKQKPTVTLSMNVGLASPTYMPEMCDAGQWYELMNDAQVNIGNSPYVTENELQAWQEGAPGHESYDYYEAMFKDVTTRQQYTLSLTGGNDRVEYFASFNYTNDDGLLKKNSTSYNQFSLRSNLHAKITKDLSLDVNLYGMSGTRKQGYMNYASVFFVSIVEPPVTPVYANGNEDYYNNFTFGVNPVAGSNTDLSGYDNHNIRTFQSLAALTYDAPFLKGLQFKAQVAYDVNENKVKKLGKAFDLYSYDAGTDTYKTHLTNSPANIYQEAYSDDRLFMQAMLSYNRKFAEKHDVGAVVAFEGKRQTGNFMSGRRYYDFYTIDDLDFGRVGDMTNSGNSSEARYLSLIGRFNYGFKDKYLAEFAFRYDGSYRYSPEHRWAWFPMGSIGWKISEEPWVKNNAAFITNLKLRASFGVSGEDAGDPFQYVAGYMLNSGGASFASGDFTSGVKSPAITNPDLTWYTSYMYDVGFDFSFWKGMLAGEFDLFRRDRTGLLANRLVSLPNTFGATLPQENLNSDSTQGIELTLSHSNNIGDFFYSIEGNMCLSRTKTIYAEESSFNSSWDRWRNQSTGRWQNIVWGYELDGQFMSYEEIAESPLQNGSVGNDKELPGDYRIKDVNGDGHIDSTDMLPLFWGSSPIMYYGLTISASWRGFDFNMLWQGAAGYTVRYRDCYGTMLYQSGNTPEYFMDRWHLADPYDETSGWVPGKWPAIRPDGNTGCLYYETELWRRNASYVRLKSVELGYSFSSKMLSRAKIGSLRIYVNGNNLLTFCDEFVKAFDPEKAEGASSSGINYPLTKCFNIGASITF